MNCVYQIALNQKLSHITYAKSHLTESYRVNRKWCKFSSHVKKNGAKRNYVKLDLACIKDSLLNFMKMCSVIPVS